MTDSLTSTNWEHLTDPMKKLVIGWLDYESRCSLRTCSKAEKSLVDSTKFRASIVRIEECKCHTDAKTIIRVNIDTFSIWFIGKRGVTKVDRGWNGEPVTELSELKQENRHKLAKKFLDRFFRKRPVSTDLFRVERFDIEPHDDWLFKCSSLKLCKLSHGNSCIWLENMLPQPKYKSIVVSGDSSRDYAMKLPIPSKILNVTQRFHVAYGLLISEEQFDAIEAIDLKASVINVSQESIKKKWRKFLENGKIDQSFDIIFKRPRNFKLKNLLPEDVDVKKKDSGCMFEDYYLNLKFPNVHGVQGVRYFFVNDKEGYIRINCFVHEKLYHGFGLHDESMIIFLPYRFS